MPMPLQNADRVARGRTRQTFEACADELPDGVSVTPAGADGDAHLVLGDELLAWSPAGDTGRRPRPGGQVVSVLTPRSTVAAIRGGYVPESHRSASTHRRPATG